MALPIVLPRVILVATRGMKRYFHSDIIAVGVMYALSHTKRRISGIMASRPNATWYSEEWPRCTAPAPFMLLRMLGGSGAYRPAVVPPVRSLTGPLLPLLAAAVLS